MERPPYGGREHATLLVSPELDELRTLAVFKSRFDDYGRKGKRPELAAEALRWLETNAVAGGVKPVVIYNHPSRKDDDSMENVKDVLQWRRVNDLVIGFEGAPGHQGDKRSVGSYGDKVKTIDRWDPVVAQVGDAWDTLLGQGLDVWGARADSDFHNNNPNDVNDYWPGQFSETWLYVPNHTANGALQAFRAGSFFAVHGHIARQVELTIEAPGLPRPAGVGEVVALPCESSFTINLRCVVPGVDWQGRVNQVDTIEFICVTADSAAVHLAMPLDKDGTAKSDPIAVPPGGMVVRARGRRDMPGGPNLLFYTNPIRIQSGN